MSNILVTILHQEAQEDPITKKLTAKEKLVAEQVSDALVTILKRAQADGLTLSFDSRFSSYNEVAVEDKSDVLKRAWNTITTAIDLTNAFMAYTDMWHKRESRGPVVARHAEVAAAEKLGLLKKANGPG